MSTLEIRRRVPRTAWRLAAAPVLLLVAGLLLVPINLAVLVWGEPRGSALAQALGALVLGGFFLGRGLKKLPTARALLARPVVLRLDDAGVELRMLDVAAQVTRSEGPMSVLRFVPRDDSCVHAPAPDAFTLVKATSLGVSPVAAHLALLQGRTSGSRVPLVLDWLREHRPELPVTGDRDAAHPG